MHTAEPTEALSFCAKVVGFSHRLMEMGPGEYHLLFRNGVDRGGVTGPPAWRAAALDALRRRARHR